VPADPDAQRWQEAFGARVRLLRDERLLSQEQLAHLAGIHPTYLSGVERGKRNLSLVNIHRIASALGLDVERLFSD
jgi:transcriptional regulator with XRE-family HTH domain